MEGDQEEEEVGVLVEEEEGLVGVLVEEEAALVLEGLVVALSNVAGFCVAVAFYDGFLHVAVHRSALLIHSQV